MDIFITALPVFDSSMAVRAHYLVDQTGDKALSVKNDFRGKSEELASPGLDLLEKVGTAPFAGDTPLFVEISRFQLMMATPARLRLSNGQLVCVLPGGLPEDEFLLSKCAEIKQRGISIALSDYPLDGASSQFFSYAEYLILDYQSPYFTSLAETAISRLPNTRLVIGGVHNLIDYNELSRGKFNRALFFGDFYSQPITMGVHRLSPIKANVLQLLRQTSEPDFEFSEIINIIERDPSLTLTLLKFLNSAAVGLDRRVESVQQAVTMLGQDELRRWATISVSIELAQDRPGEIAKLSLVRAKFAENLAEAFLLGEHSSGLFITGLFSLLDVVLQKPMENAIQEIAVDDTVKNALVSKTGPFAPVLDLVYAYERGDWSRVSISMIHNNIAISQISGAFINALVWYNQLLSTINHDEDSGQ